MDLKLRKLGPAEPTSVPTPAPPVTPSPAPAEDFSFGVPPVPTDHSPLDVAGCQEPVPKGNFLVRLFLGFSVCFLFFYCLADYTSFTAGQIHPGELVYSNTMIQLWTATYRLAFIMGTVMALIALLSAKGRGLWQFFKPTPDEPGFDLAYSIKHHLTPAQRVWLFYIVFFGFCFLFVLLLSVKLPESVSVTP